MNDNALVTCKGCDVVLTCDSGTWEPAPYSHDVAWWSADHVHVPRALYCDVHKEWHADPTGDSDDREDTRECELVSTVYALDHVTVSELLAMLQGAGPDDHVCIYVSSDVAEGATDWYSQIDGFDMPNGDGISTVVLTVGRPFDTREL